MCLLIFVFSCQITGYISSRTNKVIEWPNFWISNDSLDFPNPEVSSQREKYEYSVHRPKRCWVHQWMTFVLWIVGCFLKVLLPISWFLVFGKALFLATTLEQSSLCLFFPLGSHLFKINFREFQWFGGFWKNKMDPSDQNSKEIDVKQHKIAKFTDCGELKGREAFQTINFRFYSPKMC